MYSLIRTWFNTIVTALNAIVGTNLTEADEILDEDDTAAPQAHYTYTIKLDSIEQQDEFESSDYDIIKVFVFLKFQVVNLDITNYTTLIDSYVYAIRKYLEDNSTTALSQRESGTKRILEIRNVKCLGLNNFKDGFFEPRLEFELKTIDT